MEKKAFAWLILSASGPVGIVPQDEAELELKDLQETVGGHIEIVVPIYLCQLFNPFLRMVVDEMGLYKDYELNKIASALYGHPIVGDVAICTAWNSEPMAEPDVYAMEWKEAVKLRDKFLEIAQSIEN